MFLIVMTVKHITDHNYLLRLIQLQLGYQPLHVFLKNTLRHGNTRFAKVAGFAKVQIGKDKRFFFLPENTAVG